MVMIYSTTSRLNILEHEWDVANGFPVQSYLDKDIDQNAIEYECLCEDLARDHDIDTFEIMLFMFSNLNV